MPRRGAGLWALTSVGLALYLLDNVRPARGAVSLVSLVLLLGLAAGGYCAWLFVPVYVDNLDVREASTAAFNRMAADPDNDRVRTFLLNRTKQIGTHWESEGGTRVEKRGLDLTDSDLILERDAEEHTGHVQVDYQREVRLWPTERFVTVDFHVEKAGKLAP
jgi:hypothetical protein